ncbi:calmodulin-2/4-like [Dendroctonus ponderosae]|uniref:calmodulin-2/4-like n=1 Tax=Dendroctonus ponderosae TaxID=77166 RepID=UPI0020358CE0|nr:calmodulin-2/4-like [Dendroctonus ponderosae]
MANSLLHILSVSSLTAVAPLSNLTDQTDRDAWQLSQQGDCHGNPTWLRVSGDGNVSFEEFLDMAWTAGAGTDPDQVLSREEEEKELRDAFRVFDKHNRGYITASDLRAVLQCLGEDLSEEEIEDMIKEVDVDGDGRIDFYEFVNALGEPGNDDSYEEDDDDYAGY